MKSNLHITKLITLILALSTGMTVFSQTPFESVNPFIGTGAHGHTFPGATTPHGAVQLSPDTRIGGNDACSGYHYDDEYILGFSHTHLSGTGITDLGDILVRPFEGKQHFSHTNETAQPGYYSVTLDNGTKCELTATTYCGMHRYTKPLNSGRGMKLHIDLSHLLSSSEYVTEAKVSETAPNEIIGYRKTIGTSNMQDIYFVVRFDKLISSAYLNRYISETDGMKTESAVFDIDFNDDNQVIMKVGISCNSIEAAKQNLEHDIQGFNFDKVKADARRIWENELSRITVTGGTSEQRTIFYTALYHTLITPNIISDSGEPHKRYSTISTWDSFRAWSPLMTLIDPDLVNDIINSMLAHYDATGTLPAWNIQGVETSSTIGYHAASIIWDAYQKGIQGFDAEKALKAMIASSENSGNGSLHYAQNGFIPNNLCSQSVSTQLELAYDDWCTALMANALGHTGLYEKYMARAVSYINLFDGSTRFFRGKRADGNMSLGFDPYEVSQDYTQATAWQYRFFVPHDIDGMIQLYGGTEPFASALDSLFTTTSATKGTDHNITGLIGQYAHGNEPSHHMAFLYDYVGKPEKTNLYVQRIMNEMYNDTPDGLCGNEDCGQLSAWYIFAAMGYYPVCPGSGTYATCSPTFESVAINGTDIKLLNAKPYTYQGASRLICSIPSPDNDLYLFESKSRVQLLSATPGAKIHYTTDGSTPTESSPLYKKNMKIKSTSTLKARAFKPGYEPSAVMSVKAIKALYLPETKYNMKKVEEGVNYTYIDGQFSNCDEVIQASSMPEGTSGRTIEKGKIPVLDLGYLSTPSHGYGMVLEGYIFIPITGVYTMRLTSEAGSRLYIDDEMVVDNETKSLFASTGRTALTRGLHPYRIVLHDHYHSDTFRLEWLQPRTTEFRKVNNRAILIKKERVKK